MSLSEHFVDFANQQVSEGRYGSTSEVVRAGLRLLEEHEKRLRNLKLALAEGRASGIASDFDFDTFIDEIGSDESHELSGLLSVLGSLIEQYEEDSVHIDDALPADVLRFLMAEHGLKQADLAAEIGSQGIVSEVLNGKRKLNARQAKALGERFGVSPAVFL